MQDPFLNKIIFKKYKINKEIGKGNFGKVYEGTNIQTTKKVAIKIEKKWSTKGQLERECYYLYFLKSPGFPKLISFGKTKTHNILIEELLGKNLNVLQKSQKNNKFSIKDTCMIGLQIIDRLEFLHSKYIIHRDIKPTNFLIGKNNPSEIYIIDFGLAMKYRSSQTKNHIQFTKTKGVTGNFSLLSVNGLKSMQQSRRDDLESLCYMLILFIKGKLPWGDVIGKTTTEIYYKILKLKIKIKEEELCESLPSEFLEFLKYCKKLEFNQNPNYEYLKNLLNNILLKIKEKNDFKFSWIKNEHFKSFSVDREFFRELRINKKKSISPQARLLKKIEISMSNKSIGAKQNILNDTNGKDDIDKNIKINLNLSKRENLPYNYHFGFKKINNANIKTHHHSNSEKIDDCSLTNSIYIFENRLINNKNEKIQEINNNTQFNLKNDPIQSINIKNNIYKRKPINYYKMNHIISLKNLSGGQRIAINNNIKYLHKNINNSSCYNSLNKINQNYKLIYKNHKKINSIDLNSYGNKILKNKIINYRNNKEINSDLFNFINKSGGNSKFTTNIY